jgi:hypothetical protein
MRHDVGLKKDTLLKSRRKTAVNFFSSGREQKRIDGTAAKLEKKR